MALIFASRNILRQSLKLYAPTLYSAERKKPISTSGKQNESFLEKNERLKRPLSPHLSIYKPQITILLSGTHRATGIALSGGLYILSLGTLAMSTPYPQLLEIVQNWHIAAPLIFSFKFALAWSVFYHTANGIRHLFWDMGYGYDMKTLYKTGYAVLGTSLLASAIAASV